MPDELQRPQPLILNVNDSEGARYLVNLMLAKAGYKVIDAATGKQALEEAARCRPDLMVLDVRLPDISGLEVCRRIRADPELASTKILHTSATFVSPDHKVESLQGGSDAYLTQPFEAQELIATIQSLLRLAWTERELRERADELREADRRKNEFLAMLAHELRNPLAAISSSLPIVSRREPQDDADQRAREVLRRQTAHLGRLVDDLLDVARVTQGKIELSWTELDLSELLRRVATSVEQTRMEPRQQRLRLRLPDRPVIIRGDVTRLEQIFSNLLDNASKYTETGGNIELSATFVPVGRSALARVCVKDDGIGIAPQVMPTLFSLFSQADVPIARSRGGLGIGLTLVKTLTQLHGGTIVGTSGGLGHGSEFIVQLPARWEATEEEAHRPTHDGHNGKPGISRRVLIVEDNSDAQQALADLLEIWGHQVDTASDGLEGTRKALALRPEVALIDIGLPGIDGFEVARRIRQDAAGKALMLVALTGYGAPEQRAKALESGFDLHLVKPVDPERLSALISLGREPHA